MRLTVLLLISVIVFAGGSVRKTAAQTVQLPSFHSFSVNTTVLAPDQGTAGAGGVRRTGSAWRGYGPVSGGTSRPGGTSRAGGAAAAGARVGVVIHDLQQFDEQLLGASPADPNVDAALANRPNELLSGPLPSVAAIRRMKAMQSDRQPPKSLAKANPRQPGVGSPQPSRTPGVRKSSGRPGNRSF